MLAEFFSPEPIARIEPADFMNRLLSHRGLEVASFGLKKTVIIPLIPELGDRLRRTLGSPPPHPYKIQRQTLYNSSRHPFSVIASPMGAPMAAMLLEQLIALGARRFIYLGFCGALATTYRIGDGFIPIQAIREEGTSYHYLPPDVASTASPHLNAILQGQAMAHSFAVQQGNIWTTDAPYRETAQKIARFQKAGVHTVDMEMAALFAVARYRNCDIGALLLVSDECYHPTWQPGFGAQRLRQACQTAVNVCVTAATCAAELEP